MMPPCDFAAPAFSSGGKKYSVKQQQEAEYGVLSAGIFLNTVFFHVSERV
jgi:hypothetical protein